MLETKITLDLAAASGCSTPGCDHTKHDGPLYLEPSCHPYAPVKVSYAQGSGVLGISCAVCRRPVARIAVAERAGK